MKFVYRNSTYTLHSVELNSHGLWALYYSRNATANCSRTLLRNGRPFKALDGKPVGAELVAVVTDKDFGLGLPLTDDQVSRLMQDCVPSENNPNRFVFRGEESPCS